MAAEQAQACHTEVVRHAGVPVLTVAGLRAVRYVLRNVLGVGDTGLDRAIFIRNGCRVSAGVDVIYGFAVVINRIDTRKRGLILLANVRRPTSLELQAVEVRRVVGQEVFVLAAVVQRTGMDLAVTTRGIDAGVVVKEVAEVTGTDLTEVARQSNRRTFAQRQGGVSIGLDLQRP